MTPADKPEAQGSNGAGASTPPWQRVAKEEDAPAASAGGATSTPPAGSAAGQAADPSQAPTAMWPSQATTTEVRQPAPEPPRADEPPVVTGTAANRLFGDTGAQDAVPPSARPDRDRSRGGRATPTALRRPGRGPRRASLQIKRFDPWSVLKLSLVLGVALFFVWLVAVGVLYTVLDGMGVWDNLNGTYTQLVQGEGTATAAEPLISAGRVFGIAAIIGAVNIVLLSALTTVSAFIYNVSADLAGGLEVTLSERE
ncbi:DUF3566 domain-containing protein [Amycolatopsis suaedae]|uniref:DUF3566 domain-containing protein n=1 Tax=Amycolatopsis suaedae TaxID=2510978 RepID=A0A4Q7JB12_9PSEU|nr:DUF3566 domain-containing protein [Amycolatopsis suaedae]RZQ64990.1 hypothetical protein EWH70_03540 [Amycolatopsis suaedae]